MNRRYIPFLLLLACGKSRQLGEGLDEAGGREGQGGSTGAPIAAGGIVENTILTECLLPPNIQIVDVGELDASSWPTEEQCETGPVEEPVPTLDVKPLVGRWSDGAGDARIELVLDESGRGTLTLGEPAELPEPDAEEAYLTDIGALDARGVVIVRARALIHGFEYSVVPRNGRASELTFGIRSSEPWAEWCALQTPVRGPHCYGCEFFADGTAVAGAECGDRVGCYVSQNSHPNQYARVHCGRSTLCGWRDSVCSCNKDSCASQPALTDEFVVSVDPFDESVSRFVWSGNTRYLSRQD